MQKLNKNKNIFDHRNCLTKEEQISYAKGKLSEKAKHHVEKHLLDCELCTEALEGILLLEDPSMLENISNDMIRRLREEKFIIKKNKMRPAYLAAAAIVTVFLLSGIYFAFIRNAEDLKQEVADLPPENEVVSPAAPAVTAIDDSSEKLAETFANSITTETQKEQSATFEPQDKKEKPVTNITVTASAADRSTGGQAQEQPSPGVFKYNDAAASDERAKEEITVADDKETQAAVTENAAPVYKSIRSDSLVTATATSENYPGREKARMTEMKSKNAENNLQRIQENTDEALKNVQKKMEHENFNGALKELKKLTKEHPGDMNVIYYTGLVYYETNETAKALNCFTEVLNSGDKKLFEDARLHKALTYVKMNDKLNARKILSQVIADKSIYKERAERILELMDGN